MLKDRYLLDKKLGDGGTSAVYLAHDRTLLEKRWVVKILKEGSVDRDWFRKHFQREITALTRLDGRPGIVAVSDAGVLSDGTPYFVMQHVEGRTLKFDIAQGPMDYWRVGHIVRQVGDALSAAHAMGIYHLDVKPGNIILQNVAASGPRAWLIDFGTAKIMGPERRERAEVTQLAGTPTYMAPERFVGRPSPTSDVYSLGVVAFEMLTGRPPLSEELIQLDLLRASKKKDAEFPHPIPEAALKTISRALALSPADRQDSPAAFGEELARTLSGSTFHRNFSELMARTAQKLTTPPTILLLLVSLLAAVAAGLFIVHIRTVDSVNAGTTPVGATVRSGADFGSDEIDELHQAYRSRHEDLWRNLFLQFMVDVVAVLVVLSGTGHIRLRGLGATVSIHWLYFVIPLALLYLWLEFGFALDDLIKLRAEAWKQISELGIRTRALAFNDGGFIDGWFMCFRPNEHAINTEFLSGAAFFLCLAYGPLFVANHACAVTLLYIGAQRYLHKAEPPPLKRVLVSLLPWCALAVIAISHWQFRFGGRNPNWLQPTVAAVSLALAGFWIHRVRRAVVTF